MGQSDKVEILDAYEDLLLAGFQRIHWTQILGGKKSKMGR